MEFSLNRRTFVKAAGALGALATMGVGLSAQNKQAFAADAEFSQQKQGQPVEAKVDPKTGQVTVNKDVVVRYSACLGCYSSCGNRVKIDRETGRVMNVCGNPYNPSCAFPYLNFEEPLEKAYQSMSYADGKGNKLRGTVCGRGNATFDAYSQPNRITQPLKRAGKRGEGKWKPISWDQLIQEVTEGGKLFADLGEDRTIEGFKAIHDTTTPFDPDKPNLGPKSNQLVMLGGRGDGRAGVTAGRFAGCFGTLNNYGHGAS
jgi:tetrathionate reductase subunit A